ncbi:MAG: 3-deoxy-D-manno-octulosonic acid transferase [Rhodospirillales bacterium]|nr:3-deoxy-D-manno-octulosonic acid transferase [Rhodospirillales bacterium]
MILGLYRAATQGLAPLVDLYLAQRRRRGKEDGARFPERRGIAAHPRPAGPLIWIHGASVGEALSALPLVERLAARAAILVTTGTVTSAALLAERLPANAFHQYVPVDRLPWVRRFLDHWGPDLALWLESEFWPNLMLETAARRIPMALINGRVSDRSLASWRRMPGAARTLLGCFAWALGQSDEDARRLALLGARHTGCVGNLKYAALPLPVDESGLARLQAEIGGRPLWLAASTHAGEEALAARVHARLKAEIPGLLTLVVPRHPARGPAIAQELAASGMVVARRGADQPIAPATDLYLADTMGELGLFYRLAPLVLIGKTLTAAGGQNPLEAARLGCALLWGPRMDNFKAIAARLEEAGAAQAVADEGDLVVRLRRLLADAPERAKMGAIGIGIAQAEADVLDRLIERLAPDLARLDARP